MPSARHWPPPAASADTSGLLAKFRDGPMRDVEEIVFAARAGHWYVNFGYYSHDPDRKAYAEGTKLYRLNLRTRELTALLADARGGARDPQVSYNGKKILFSYRPGGTEQYHLYEMNLTAVPGHTQELELFDQLKPCWTLKHRV